MNLHATSAGASRPRSRLASPRAGLSCSLNHLAEERYDQRINYDSARQVHDRAKMGALNSVVEIYPPDVVKRRAVVSQGMAAEAVRATEHCRIESRFRAPVHLLALFEQGSRKNGSTFVEGLPRSTLRNYRRKLIFVPAGREYYDWQEPSTLVQGSYFYFDPAALPVNSDLGFADTSLAPRLFFEDAGLWDTAFKLKTLIEHSNDNDRLYGEALGVVLAHELVRLSLGAIRVEPPVRGGLAGWQQRAVGDYIEEHLAEQISLGTLAQLARLSPYHFCRAFKQSFGVPPHRFHTRRRIEQAKVLLAKRAASVTEVGIAVGYSETSAFTATFRKVTGLTPSGYHRSVI